MTAGNMVKQGSRRTTVDWVRYRFGRFAVRAPLLCLVVALQAACASDFSPEPVNDVAFLERKQVQQDGAVTVAAAVPSAGETRRLFGASLYGRGVQPVWLEIENRGTSPLSFLPLGLDPVYFTPIEVAALQQTEPAKLDTKMSRYYFESGIPVVVDPGGTRSGFVFTSLDEGTKTFNVDLVGEGDEQYRFTFFIPVPGLKIDHHNVDWDNLYPADTVTDYSDTELKRYLETLPCCTTDRESKEQGDPLNIVVVGEPKDVYYAFIRAGWDETETVYRASAIKTAMSFLFGGRYRYAPVSSLYAFGRPQDVALQKARSTIHERNHLRLWLTSARHKGKPVWIGQISRDIGVRFTTKTILTHKIDPDVDETREFLLENLAYAQSLSTFGYVGGVGPATLDEPRGNLTGDPYFTDGYRVVLWVSPKPVDITQIEVMPWPLPHER